MKGKEKCKALKEIREQIAKENDIPFITSQCTHQGDCKGTCPKCESELRYLERQLAIRQNLGKAVAVVGISVGACSTLAACNPARNITDVIDTVTDEPLAGDVIMVEPESEYEYDGGLEPYEFESDIMESETESENELAGAVKPDITCEVLEGDISLPME